MRLIKLEGDISKVTPNIDGKVPWGLWGKPPCYALIETEVCGLPTQIRYVVYQHKDSRYYCKVQRERVFLENLDGYYEARGLL